MNNEMPKIMKSSSTDLVHTQSALNDAVRCTRQNLANQGVEVKRRELENALAPVLVSGKTHAVASKHLKDKPHTAQGMINNLVVDKDNKSLIKMLEALQNQIRNADCFQNYFDRYGKRVANIFKEIKISNYLEIVGDQKLVAMINAMSSLFDVKPDVYHIEIRNVGERFDYCLFDFEIVVNKHSLKFKGEDMGFLRFDELVVNGIDMLSPERNETKKTSEIIEWVGSIYHTLKGEGMNSISNKFDLDVSPTLIEMLVTCAKRNAPEYLVRSKSEQEVSVIKDSFVVVDTEHGLIGNKGFPVQLTNDVQLFDEESAKSFAMSLESAYVTPFSHVRIVSGQELKELFWGWVTEDEHDIWEDPDTEFCNVFNFCSYYGDGLYIPDDSGYSIDDIAKLKSNKRDAILNKVAICEDKVKSVALGLLQNWSDEEVFSKAQSIHGIRIFQSNGLFLVSVNKDDFDNVFFDTEWMINRNQ